MTNERGSMPSFDTIALHLAEAIDTILMTERESERRLELIRKQVRRALSLGYRAGRRP
jgi:hypothetical protein